MGDCCKKIFHRWKLWFIALLPAVVCLILLTLHALQYRETILWDFATDYNAALLFRNGDNPYDIKMLSNMTGMDLPYVYPLVTTFFFMPFTFLNVDAAAMVWLGLILFILSSLVFGWWRTFMPRSLDVMFPAACFLIFNMALPKNVLTGNICSIETALIWTGFFFLTQGRTLPFALLVGIAGSFKLATLAFLGIPLLHRDTRRWRDVLLGVLLPVIVLGASYLIKPAWFDGYMANVTAAVDIWGAQDPSLYAVSRRFLGSVASFSPWLPAPFMIAYGTALLVIAVFAWLTLRRLTALTWPRSAMPLMMYACLVYALVMPRYSDYQYLLIIPATWYVLRVALPQRLTPYWIAFLMVPLPFVEFYSGAMPGDITFNAWGHWNLLVLTVAWAVFTKGVLSGNYLQWNVHPMR